MLLLLIDAISKLALNDVLVFVATKIIVLIMLQVQKGLFWPPYKYILGAQIISIMGINHLHAAVATAAGCIKYKCCILLTTTNISYSSRCMSLSTLS